MSWRSSSSMEAMISLTLSSAGVVSLGNARVIGHERVLEGVLHVEYDQIGIDLEQLGRREHGIRDDVARAVAQVLNNHGLGLGGRHVVGALDLGDNVVVHGCGLAQDGGIRKLVERGGAGIGGIGPADHDDVIVDIRIGKCRGSRAFRRDGHTGAHDVDLAVVERVNERAELELDRHGSMPRPSAMIFATCTS